MTFQFSNQLQSVGVYQVNILIVSAADNAYMHTQGPREDTKYIKTILK